MRRRWSWVFVLALAATGGGAASCDPQVLISGVSGPRPGSGAPDAGSGGQGSLTARSPVCDESLFAQAGLRGTQLPGPLSPALFETWGASAASGDWNRDGVPDLALADGDLAIVSVVLGNPDGTFRPPTDYPTGTNPAGVAARDLNGDGTPDLVVVNKGSASATVLLGKGDGTFGARADYPTVGAMPRVVAIGDWTSDGKLDVIAGDTLFAGKGDGTFARGVTYGYEPDALATADVDLDGKPDLVLVQLDAAYVLLARGDGTFLRKNALQLGEYDAHPTLGDLNGDRVPDLTIVGPCPAENNSAFYLMLGAGDGSFRLTQTSNFQPCSLPLLLGDVNGDGETDLQFGLQETWFGNGDGTFARFLSGSVNQRDVPVNLADWNGDGHLDVAVLDENEVLKTLPGDGTGSFGRVRSYPLANPASLPASDLLVDLDGDGRLDLPILSDEGLEILPGNADGTFATQAPYVVAYGAYQAEDLRTADLNGDGVPDLIFFGSPGNGGSIAVTVALNLTGGRFGPSIGVPVPGGLGGLGDMDGDGLVDLVVTGGDDSGAWTATTLFGRGDGTFGRSVETDLGVNTGALVFADLDGDGRLDGLLADGYGQDSATLVRFTGHADGSFMFAGDAIGSPLPPLTGPIAVADLNGDGYQDVVLADQSGAISVHLGVGGGTFAADAKQGPRIDKWSAWGRPVAVDVNADGALDLASSSGWLLLGRGDGTFGCSQSISPDSYGSVAFGDVNRDGKIDAVTVSGVVGTQSDAALTVLLAH